MMSDFRRGWGVKNDSPKIRHHLYDDYEITVLCNKTGLFVNLLIQQKYNSYLVEKQFKKLFGLLKVPR